MSRATATPLHAIRLLVLDVDGVLTDGRLFYGPQGEEIKVFHVHDGLGLRQVQQVGVSVAVISGRSAAAVELRCLELGITMIEQGVENKVEALERMCVEAGIPPYEALCVIDDTTDLPLAHAVGYSVAVANAHQSVRDVSNRVTTLPGGLGAVREVCDWLIAARSGRQ